ncbi:MAG TPA: phosphoglycerate dehydrogenase [Polyangiales bacterium]|nr:phosphoglycerate dehydrogenase [Polyangiales bacterium]
MTAIHAHSQHPPSEVRVLLLENIHDSALQLFAAERFRVERLSSALSEAELHKRLADVHILGIRSKTQVTQAVLAEAKQLLTVGCFCIGTNQVDIGFSTARGLPVFNAPFSNTRSVAELMIAEIVMLARQLGDRLREMHGGTWRKTADNSHEIRGKTLGIIGYGHIGSQLGVLAEACGMRVIFYDRVTKLPIGNNRACTTLAEVLSEADFVSLHVPATRETHDMIGADELAQMKRGACLLNASRGTVVQIPALAAALKSGQVGGAAIDVFPEEPESNSNGFVTELQGLPNVILSPHIGGSTSEAQESIGREVASALIKFVTSGATIGSVNFPELEMPSSPNTHRVLNVHKNVPGVLRDVNRIVSERNANIHSQMLKTHENIGYLIMDLDQDVSREVCRDISNLETNIRTRILY